MTDLRKAAEMALEVMEYNRANGTPNMGAAIEALRQALAQPVDAVNMTQESVDKTEKCEHEPVAIVNEGMGGIEWLYKPLPDDTLLYAAPQKREWQGLTDEEREQATGWSVEHIESYLKEKNNG